MEEVFKVVGICKETVWFVHNKYYKFKYVQFIGISNTLQWEIKNKDIN